MFNGLLILLAMLTTRQYLLRPYQTLITQQPTINQELATLRQTRLELLTLLVLIFIAMFIKVDQRFHFRRQQIALFLT